MVKLWTLGDAERELRRVLETTDAELRAEIVSAGDDPDAVVEQFDAAVWAAIAQARREHR